MTLLSYIGTAMFSACAGFAICGILCASRVFEAEGQRDRLAIGLSNASNMLRAASMHEAADHTFAVLDDNGGVSC